MANGSYIGKISALVTASTADLSRKLRGSAQEVNTFANQVRGQFQAASRSAEASLNQIFTPLQRLQRALTAGSGPNLDILTDDQIRKLQQAISLSEQINKPLAQAARTFSGLSSNAAAAFAPAISQAQAAAVGLSNALAETGSVGVTQFERAQRVVDETTASLKRLEAAQRAAAAGFTGEELQFRRPRALEEINASAAASQRIAALPASQREDPGLRERVRQLAQFRELIVSTAAQVESLELTPDVDSSAIDAARRRLDQIIETSRRARAEFDEVAARAAESQRLAVAASGLLQVDQRESQLLSRSGESVDIRARVQAQGAIRRAVEEEAAFRQRAADAAERETAAVERLSQAQNRVLAAEIDRSSGAAARRNAAAFDAATDEILRRDDRPRREFGIERRTRESELARSRELEQRFLSLPDSDRAALEGQRRGVEAFIESVESGGTSVGVFSDRLDDLEQGMADVEARAARIRDASRLLVIDEEATRRNDLLNQNEGRRTGLRDRLAEQGRRRVRGLTGDFDIDSTPPPDGNFAAQAQRDIDALGARVGAVRQQLETLPNSVRTRFIPELQRAQAQLVRLQNSPNATVDAIENATLRVQRLEAAARRASEAFNFRQSFGGAGLRGIEQGLNQQALQGYTAQLQLLQQTLAGTSQAARGPAIAAFDRLRNAIADAMDRGTLETRQTRDEIQRLTQDAVAAAAAAARINPRALNRRLQRVGDVARGAFGSAGLAIQQAAFAVDDFFSVTGGLDQRIRAAANNISQLGFITGSTTGLILGVAASIGSQLVVALLRWANAGTEAQDRTRALNEAIARQKSLVEELAQAFDSLGDRLLRGVFSPAAEEAREVANQLDEIRRKQRELRDASVIDLDPDVQRQRAIQGARQRQLEGEDDVGRRIALQEQIAAARRAEQQAAAAAVARAVPTPQQLQEALLRTIFRDSRGAVTPAGRQQAEQIRREVAGAAGDPRQLIQLLRQARTGQERLALQNSFNQVRAPQARDNVEALTRLINALERQLGTGIDAAANRLIQSVDRPAANLRAAQDRLREAVAAGVPGAAALVNSVNEIGAGLDAARQTLVDRLNQGLPLDQATVDAATRQRDAALANVEATLRESAAIDVARQALDRFAAALDQASQEAQSNLQSAQQAADEARRADLGRSTPLTQAARDRAEADLARQRDLASGVEEEIAAARERLGQRFAAFAGVEQDVEARRGDARQRGIELQGLLRARLDEIADIFSAPFGELPNGQPLDRRAFDELSARFGRPIEGLSDLEALQSELGKEFDSITAAFRDLSASLDAELQAAGGELIASFRRIAEIDELLQTQGVLGEGQREELVRERARLEQQAIEADEQVRQARDASTREAEQAAAAIRGRELSRTDGERAAADLARGLEDIRQFFGRQAEETTGLVDFEAQAAAQQRFIDESLRSAAPAIFGLADQVANAVLQGPSRAALQATDVSTVEGSRELNRLLRGDDAARDQNLVELQKQSQSLDELVRLAREGGAQVAN